MVGEEEEAGDGSGGDGDESAGAGEGGDGGAWWPRGARSKRLAPTA